MYSCYRLVRGEWQWVRDYSEGDLSGFLRTMMLNVTIYSYEVMYYTMDGADYKIERKKKDAN